MPQVPHGPAVMGCPSCGEGKRYTTKSFGKYKVYVLQNTFTIKMICCSCQNQTNFKYVAGAVTVSLQGNSSYSPPSNSVDFKPGEEDESNE